MNDQNKNKSNQRPEETPKNVVGAASAVKSSSGWKRLFAKRWVSPAIFMAAAAIIVTLMWIYQGTDPSEKTSLSSDPTEASQEGSDPASVEGNTEPDPADIAVGGEMMKWPVANVLALQVDTPFYDTNATAAEKEAALIQVDNTFMPHMGIDLVDPNGQTFDVMAAMSGKVTHVQKHPTNGATVEISHGNGLVTVYQSLTNVQVEVGTELEQGAVFASAGRNELESDIGVHLHFEARLNGENINPSSYIQK